MQCPGEMLETDKGRFFWDPVDHGIVARLPCPYGMNTNYTEYLENLAHDYAVGLGYHPFHNPNAPSKPQVKMHDLQNGNAYHQLTSNGELRVSHENFEIILKLRFLVLVHMHLSDINIVTFSYC